MLTDPVRATLAVAAILEGLRIPYVVGGSMASTFHGEPRTTAAVDLALQLSEDGIDPLLAALAPEFFAQRESVRRAVRGHTSFNAVHRPTMVTIDAYVRPAEGIYASEIERARLVQLGTGAGGTVRIASAEDTLLHKLRWYRMSKESSQRQWRDVRGILKASGSGLDRSYLAEWAERLELTDLLERALSEVGNG